MNILFYTRFRPTYEKGGTEHTTSVVARELHRLYSINSFAAYRIKTEGTVEGFNAEIQLNDDDKKAEEQIASYIEKHDINYVIIQNYYREMNLFYHVLKNNKHCHLLFGHHFSPGARSINKEIIIGKINKNTGIKRFRYQAKLCLFPIFLWLSKFNLRKRYNRVFRQSKRVIVLSESYIHPFMHCAMVHDRSKIIAIPNALPFKPFTDDGLLDNKERIVLMVTRLDERQKRIKLALRIWKQVMQDNHYKDWKLIIVGDGDSPCVDKYQQYAHDNNIPAVAFTGRQQPMRYYHDAAIFMMTSLFEGLPLTLLESRQYDVVPMAFDTFSPVHELIADGENGFIVKEGDIDGYAERLKRLMADKDLREKMARKGRVYLDRYSVENVMAKWYQLFQSLS